MTTRIPVELAQVRETRDTIWEDYTRAIDERRSLETIKLLGDTGVKMDELCHEWYLRWQKVGGTSDIVSIVAAENKAEQERQAAEIAADNEWLGTKTALAYGDANLAELQAQHEDWLDEQRTREDARF